LEEASTSSIAACGFLPGIGIGLETVGFGAETGLDAASAGFEKEAGNIGFGDLISGFTFVGLDLTGAGG